MTITTTTQDIVERVSDNKEPFNLLNNPSDGFREPATLVQKDFFLNELQFRGLGEQFEGLLNEQAEELSLQDQNEHGESDYPCFDNIKLSVTFTVLGNYQKPSQKKYYEEQKKLETQLLNNMGKENN